MNDFPKFVVASDAAGALLYASTWDRHPEIRESVDVFDDRREAQDKAAELIRRAEEESPFGCKIPCDEHSRCVKFHPQVWEVRISVTLVPPTT